MANVIEFIKKMGKQAHNVVMDVIAPSVAPDRRPHTPAFVPLFQKTADDKVVYVGAFVPELLELYRVEKRVNPLQDAIIRPTKAHAVNVQGAFENERDLEHIARQVGKVVTDQLHAFRHSEDPEKQNMNLFAVPRMQAVNLYCQTFKQSAAEANVGDCFISYSGCEAAAGFMKLEPTVREARLHIAFMWLARISAFTAAITLGAVTTPLGVAIAALATYYIVSSASQFEFWDKAEAVLKNNWFLNKEYRSIREFDYAKSAKTLLILGIVIAMAYPVALGIFADVMAVQLITSVGAKMALGALMAATASIGMVQGLMSVMHSWLGLGFAKTNVTDKELANADINNMVAHNPDNYRPSKDALMADVKRLSVRCGAKVVVGADVKARYGRDIPDCTAAKMGGEAWGQASSGTKALIFNKFNPENPVKMPIKRSLQQQLDLLPADDLGLPDMNTLAANNTGATKRQAKK